MDGTPVRAVFFDLYGTLLVFPPSDVAWRAWVGAFHDLVGKPNGLSPAEVDGICDTMFGDACGRDLASGLTTYETRIRRAYGDSGIPLSPEDVRRIAGGTLEAWQVHIPPADDAREVLLRLRRTVQTVLITNFDHAPHVRRVLETYGLVELFDAILISDEVGWCKPQPEIFRLALERCRLTGSEVIHVGDTMRDDIEGALSAGIRPVLIDRTGGTSPDRTGAGGAAVPHRAIHTLSELLTLPQLARI